MSRVLVVDDKELMRDSVGATLQRAGLAVVSAPNAEAAIAMIAKHHPDAVITDLKMPGVDGLELLRRIKEADDALPVVLMTAYGTVDTAVQAMKFGAFDYITKPFEGDELVITMKRALQHAKLVRENAVLRSQVTDGDETVDGGGLVGLDRLIGESGMMRRLKDAIRAVAESHGTVLITGESGAGKEVVARAIHELSPRHDETYLAVNCAALSASLLESELFGHERGAFTGADQLRKGRFELANNGSLLLDEISEIPPSLQAKLLRVLQESSFERVGSSITQSVDVRVIATTNRDLVQSVQSREFRQDLYFRLNVLPIAIPPLRERLDDVPLLARHFLGRVAARDGATARSFSSAAIDVMQRYHWPGNVRELQNICERAHVLSTGSEIEPGLIEPWLLSDVSVNGTMNGASAMEVFAPPTISVVETKRTVHESPRRLEDVERETIVATLHCFNGHRQKTAEALGIGVRTLGLKLRKWKELDLVAQDL